MALEGTWYQKVPSDSQETALSFSWGGIRTRGTSTRPSAPRTPIKLVVLEYSHTCIVSRVPFLAFWSWTSRSSYISWRPQFSWRALQAPEPLTCLEIKVTGPGDSSSFSFPTCSSLDSYQLQERSKELATGHSE